MKRELKKKIITKHAKHQKDTGSAQVQIAILTERINELTGNTQGIAYLPPRPWDHSGKRFGSTLKAEHDLGFKATVELKKGLIQTISWTRDNLPRIRQCMDKHRAHLGE